ncbi:hypothetical protein OG339_47905 (plasmid) [Streptosporangium sp. NBC_01495]|uniref:Mom family adenine methylcarbamoylation protein n=1 Tax=Streptosporangium sp. NBC_01495 TaxID=2903899 RepID=UPI002E2FF4C9|nr:hypothetical protein [Streptosporangium sp. NBC_01495]
MTAELAPAADECLRWRHGRLHGWRHVHEGGFNRHDYLVGPVAYTEARTFTTERHYSASWPSVRLRYGLWHMATRHGLPELVGVAALSVPPRKEVLTNVFPGLQAYYQTLELGRFLMDISVPGNGESFFLGEMLRLAALDGIRGLVSFADPMPRYTAAGRLIFPGHRGTSYQAGNAIYTGRATAGNITLLPDATVLSRRTAQKIRRGEPGWRAAEQLLVASGATPRQPGENRAAWLAAACGQVGRVVKHPGNHRYLFLAGTKAQKRRIRVTADRESYPKDPWYAEIRAAVTPDTAAGA